MTVYILRCNGALIDVYLSEDRAVADMRKARRNGEFWRIEPKEIKDA